MEDPTPERPAPDRANRLSAALLRCSQLPLRRNASCAFLALNLTHFNVNRFVCARVLASALAAALLLLELLAGNNEFHNALHHNGNAASNNCVLCLFAKGHVDSPEPTPVLTPLVQPSFEPTPRQESIAFVDFTYLASPSRAPPASSSFLSVVA